MLLGRPDSAGRRYTISIFALRVRTAPNSQHARDLGLIGIFKALIITARGRFRCELNFSSLRSLLNALTSSSCLAELRISHP